MSCAHTMAFGMHRAYVLPDGTVGPCILCENERLRDLVREALTKGAERRCPWCWVVAHKGKHAPDCRAVAVLGSPIRGAAGGGA